LPKINQCAVLGLLFLTGSLSGEAGEREALAIEAALEARHIPSGTILDPVFEAPDSDKIAGYTRAGDSAIWTGHYLAAESFRFGVQRSQDALRSVHQALQGIQDLVDVTGSDVLARALIPETSPFAQGIAKEEAHNGIYHGRIRGQPFLWVGRTSRDQYLGVFFGLAAAYDLVDDAEMRAGIRKLVRRMTEKLIADGWVVRMPDGSRGSLFLGRPDHRLTILQIAQHIDSKRFTERFEKQARWAPLAALTIAADTLDRHRSYFKFNLDHIDLYSLLRLEGSGSRNRMYRWAFGMLDRATGADNPFFMVVARAVMGPNSERDQRAMEMLEEWLKRPRRDFAVDLRGSVPECGSVRQACRPLPIAVRVPTDFLWQRSPYQLYGGAVGRVESSGIDYLLPYWMGRFYGLE